MFINIKFYVPISTSECECDEGHDEENGAHQGLERIWCFQGDVEGATLSNEIHSESVSWLGEKNLASYCHVENLVNFFAIVENEHLHKLSPVIIR